MHLFVPGVGPHHGWDCSRLAWQRRTQRQCPLRRENTFCILKRNAQIKESEYGHQYSPDHLSTPFHKYNHVCCVDFRFWRGATREHPPKRGCDRPACRQAGEQRRQNRKATQPSGRRFFLAQTSLLAPCRRLKGMRWCPCGSTSRLVWAKNPSSQTWSY